MNSFTECEQFDFKCEEDFMPVNEIQAEPLDIENELMSEASGSNVFPGFIDINSEIIPISERVASIKIVSEVEDYQESVDSFLQDDRNNSEGCKTDFVPTLSQSSTTYKTDLKGEKCTYKNCILKCDNHSMCTQTVGKGFECKNGNKSYSYKSGVIKHKIDKLFGCKFCSKAFPKKRYLKKHEMLHRLEMCFVCKNCNKSFKWKSNLRRHMSIHSGEPPFDCSNCNKSFEWKNDLKRRLRLDSSKKPFMCDICSKSFSQKNYLDVHVLFNHSVETPFGCKMCSSRFRSRHDLKRHLRIHMADKFPRRRYVANVSFAEVM